MATASLTQITPHEVTMIKIIMIQFCCLCFITLKQQKHNIDIIPLKCLENTAISSIIIYILIMQFPVDLKHTK